MNSHVGGDGRELRVSPANKKKLGRVMRRHMKKNMEILSGVENHQWQRRLCCKGSCFLIFFVSCRALS